jgi:hypothetical protein
MKRILIITIYAFFPIFLFGADHMEVLLKKLDNTVDNYQIYSNRKEEKLNKLRTKFNTAFNDSQKYEICEELVNEYICFQSDSALKYVREELKIADRLNDIHKLTNSYLNRAFIMAIMGMYKESLDILQSINKDKVPDLKERYFVVYKFIYDNMADYAVIDERYNYDSQRKSFRDSILFLADPSSIDYLIAKSNKLSDNHHHKEALKILLSNYSHFNSDIRKKANIAFNISCLYKIQGDTEREKYWLIISAINDIESNNKEYISLRTLAFIFYNEGSIDLAYKYIKRSMEDALFCNARLRTFEISQMLPIIDKAYQAQTETRQKQLIISLLSISMLSLFLVIAIIYVYRQMKKLSIARKGLSHVNEQLNNLNEKLSSTNIQIIRTNKTLLEANLIKEKYIGQYMDQCSIYIDKLDDYRRLLNKAATAGKIDELLLAIKSKKFIEEELIKFYNNFDSTFLQLFPSFVKEFSDLLVDDVYVHLKPGQLLNTELRIYALMRLGINDAVKISQFLHCSISTIYNYRTRIRNKAIGLRDEFENRVLQIGSTEV